MKETALQLILSDLNGGSSEVEASAIISIDGLTRASALPKDMGEYRVGVMYAAMLSLVIAPLPNWRGKPWNSLCSRGSGLGAAHTRQAGRRFDNGRQPEGTVFIGFSGQDMPVEAVSEFI